MMTLAHPMPAMKSKFKYLYIYMYIYSLYVVVRNKPDIAEVTGSNTVQA